MESSLSDFFRQIPIGFILAPIVFGILYIIALAVIFRRATERRRKRRDAAALQENGQATGLASADQRELERLRRMVAGQSAPSAGSFGAGSAVGSAMQADQFAVPEPDLDLLTLLDNDPVAYPASSSSALITTAQSAGDPALRPAVNPNLKEITMSNARPANDTWPDDAPPDAVEVLRVYRDMNDGSLIFQVSRERFRALNEVSNPDILRRVQAIARELWTMVGGGIGQPANNARPLNAPPATTEMRQAGTQSGTSARVGGSIGGSIGNMGNIGGFMGSSGAKKADQDSAPLGIANQIETFLQNRLASSPLGNRSVHVHPGVDHGVKIEVDGMYYDDVDDVPDTAVREFLLHTMESWSAGRG